MSKLPIVLVSLLFLVPFSASAVSIDPVGPISSQVQSLVPPTEPEPQPQPGPSSGGGGTPHPEWVVGPTGLTNAQMPRLKRGDGGCTDPDGCVFIGNTPYFFESLAFTINNIATLGVGQYLSEFLSAMGISKVYADVGLDGFIVRVTGVVGAQP